MPFVIAGLGLVVLYLLYQNSHPSTPTGPVQGALPGSVPAGAPSSSNGFGVMAPPPVTGSATVSPAPVNAPTPGTNYGPIVNALGQVIAYGYGQLNANGAIDASTVQGADAAFQAAANTINLGGGSGTGPDTTGSGGYPAITSDIAGSLTTPDNTGGGGIGAALPERILARQIIHTPIGPVSMVLTRRGWQPESRVTLQGR